jgi:hypothetical protein
MSTYSSTGNVHLIVTCTRRKTVAAGETVFPGSAWKTEIIPR